MECGLRDIVFQPVGVFGAVPEDIQKVAVRLGKPAPDRADVLCPLLYGFFVNRPATASGSQGQIHRERSEGVAVLVQELVVIHKCEVIQTTVLLHVERQAYVNRRRAFVDNGQGVASVGKGNGSGAVTVLADVPKEQISVANFHALNPPCGEVTSGSRRPDHARRVNQEIEQSVPDGGHDKVD